MKKIKSFFYQHFDLILIIIAIFGIIVVLLTSKTRCEMNSVDQLDSRIIVISKCDIDGIKIYVDTETNVMYMSNKRYDAGGLVVMVNTDGDPLLYEEKSQ